MPAVPASSLVSQGANWAGHKDFPSIATVSSSQSVWKQIASQSHRLGTDKNLYEEMRKPTRDMVLSSMFPKTIKTNVQYMSCHSFSSNFAFLF